MALPRAYWKGYLKLSLGASRIAAAKAQLRVPHPRRQRKPLRSTVRRRQHEDRAGMARGSGGVRRRIELDAGTWNALDRLSKDRMATIQELAEEAFRDLLKKHHRPTTLKEMLPESIRSHPTNDPHPPPRKRSQGGTNET
jgi:hypothetical protein